MFQNEGFLLYYSLLESTQRFVGEERNKNAELEVDTEDGSDVVTQKQVESHVKIFNFK